MSTQQISLNVPDAIYQRLKKQAQESNRTLEEQTLDVLAATVGKKPQSLDDPTTLLASLELLDDAALWNAAQSKLAGEVSIELEELNFKRQREGLTESEDVRAEELSRQYERQMLLRAKAVALLKQRGQDIRMLSPK